MLDAKVQKDLSQAPSVGASKPVDTLREASPSRITHEASEYPPPETRLFPVNASPLTTRTGAASIRAGCR